MRNEIEDGMGFAGMVPSREEREFADLMRNNEMLRAELNRLRFLLQNIHENTANFATAGLDALRFKLRVVHDRTAP